MWLLVLSIVIQALLIVHCIKTGRNTIWIWVIALLSYAGIVAYVAVEMLPELLRGRTAQRTARNVKKVFNPHAELRRYENEARVTGNVASLQRYGDELARQGRHDEAIAQYKSALKGLYEHDPNLMLGIAKVLFDKGDAAGARQMLDDLIRLNPDFRSPEGHLLYARSLETEGNATKALEEYKALEHGYPGAEAAVRYAQLLQAQGQTEESRKVAREVVEEARIAPAHYRRAQKEWLDIAERIAAG